MFHDLSRLGHDAIPAGYLTLHECPRALRQRQTGYPTIAWTALTSEDNDPDFFAELASEWRLEKGFNDTLMKGFAEGQMTACARDPVSLELNRIPAYWWAAPDFPPSPFSDRPLTAPPQSRLARYSGRTLLVSEVEFDNWLKTHRQEVAKNYAGGTVGSSLENQDRKKRPSEEELQIWAHSLPFSGNEVPSRYDILKLMREHFGQFVKDGPSSRALKKVVWPESTKGGRRPKRK